MARKSKIDMEDQVKMEGIDTELSMIADEFLRAGNDVIKAKTSLDEVEQRFIDVMREHSKTSITHEGRTFSVRKGHVVKEAIVVK